MKKYYVIIGVIGIAVLAIVFLFSKDGEKEQKDVFTVASDDGAATLAIPKDVLPEGISRTDISIFHLEKSGDDRIISMYKFGPSGTVFNEPVDIKINLENIDLETNGVPLMVYLDDVSLEPVPDTELSVSQDLQSASFTGKINHFSIIAVIHGFFAVSYPGDLGKHNVLEPFPVTINVTTLPDASVQTADGRAVQLLKRDPIAFLHSQIVGGGLEPLLIRYDPLREDLGGDEFVSFTEQYECKRNGTGTLTSRLAILYGYSSVPDDASDTGYNWDWDFNTAYVYLSSEGQCIGKDLAIRDVLVKTQCDGGMEMNIETEGEALALENYKVRIVSSSGEVTLLDVSEGDSINIEEDTSAENPLRIELRANIPPESYDFQIIEIKPIIEDQYTLYEGKFFIDLCIIEEPEDEFGREGFDYDIDDDDTEAEIIQVPGYENYDSGVDITGEILMIQLSDGGYYPKAQFYTHDDGGDVTGCDDPHYRSNNDYVYGLQDLNNTVIVRRVTLNISGCGFGRTGKHIPSFIRVTDEQWGALNGAGANFEVLNVIYPN